MTFELSPLPFEPAALEPHISAQTISFHHGKHHQAYVTNLNALIKDTPLAGDSLEKIIQMTAKDDSRAGVFNNAAQVWNHAFFWQSLLPQGGGAPPAALAEKLAAAFGSVDAFKEQFKQAGITQFGSGWVWLVKDDGGALKIIKTGNAMTPLALGLTPLVTCDVWEHAYYLDFQNRRPDFLQAFLDHLINWDFVASGMKASSVSGV